MADIDKCMKDSTYGLGNPHRPRHEHLVKSINTQIFLLYRLRRVAECRHSSSYLGAAMGAMIGREDPVCAFADLWGVSHLHHLLQQRLSQFRQHQAMNLFKILLFLSSRLSARTA
jgi:hypothetical protein